MPPSLSLPGGEWKGGQIRRCYCKEKDGLQTAEVLMVDVQWDGECSQSMLPVEQVRPCPRREVPLDEYGYVRKKVLEKLIRASAEQAEAKAVPEKGVAQGGASRRRQESRRQSRLPARHPRLP